MDKIAFATNVPVELRLRFTEGKLVPSNYGDQQQYLFSTDKGPFYVSEAVGNILHDQIREQGVTAGEPVDIVKAEVDQGRGRKGIRWQLTRVGFAPGEQRDGTFVIPAIPPARPSPPPGAGVSAPAPATPATAQSCAREQPQHNGNGSANGNGAHSLVHDDRPLPAKTKIEDALKTVIAAIVAANQYARDIGYTAMPQFTGEDIRALAATLLINGERNGGGR